MAVSGAETEPLFVTGNADWYLSNGSVLWAVNAIATNGLAGSASSGNCSSGLLYDLALIFLYSGEGR